MPVKFFSGDFCKVKKKTLFFIKHLRLIWFGIWLVDNFSLIIHLNRPCSIFNSLLIYIIKTNCFIIIWLFFVSKPLHEEAFAFLIISQYIVVIIALNYVDQNENVQNTHSFQNSYNIIYYYVARIKDRTPLIPLVPGAH